MTTHGLAESNPSRERAIERMSIPAFWDNFFRYFISTVHPAEFALTDKNEKGSQRETALTAAFHRVFLAINPHLGLVGWTSAMEAPYKRTDNGSMAYCDITLFSWDGHAKDPWTVKHSPDQHVRVEVKWRDNAYFNATGVAPEEMLKAATENQSDQHFVLVLIFHGDVELPIHGEAGWDALGKDWTKLAVLREKRRYAHFSENYTHFSLVVLKRNL